MTLAEPPRLAAPCRLSIVAPCFNEASCLPIFHARASAAALSQVGTDYEIVLVNDGSTDTTLEVMRRLAARDPHVVVVNLSRNHGHQLALSAGLSLAVGNRVLILDADLQDPPELLPEMMRLMDEGAHVVYGQRRSRQGETPFKTFTARAFYRVLSAMVDVSIPLDTGDFRLLSRPALDVLNSMPERYRFVRGLVSWIGLRQVPLPYDRDARLAGHSAYNFTKMLRFAGDAITSFSIVPLRLASLFGCVTALGALMVLAYALIAWGLGYVVTGWTSVVSIILILGSVQLVVLGILGEYVGRLYLESKRRPLFIIESVFSTGAYVAEDQRPIPASIAQGRFHRQ